MNPIATEITLEMALRLCADLVNTGLRPGHYSGDYPLHQACKDGNAAFAELLLQQGADINAEDDLQMLHWAAKNGKTEVVKRLLERGATINARAYNSTALPCQWKY